ncbi:MAG: sulfatase-like hydrolase/transferase [Pseudomonadota bacterium]
MDTGPNERVDVISRWRFGPIAASILAGLVGAGVVDVLVTLARTARPSAPGALLALGLALYGTAGLVVAIGVGVLAGGVLVSIGGAGASSLRDRSDDRRDRAAATGILAGAAGVGVMAVVVAAGHKIVVRPMQSDLLATIATAGLVLAAAPLAASIAVALFRPLARWVTPHLPRPPRTGTTGLLLLVGVAGGVLATAAAFSRADWRVLDLSPFVAVAIAAAVGMGHGLFWYQSSAGRRLAPRVPATALSVLTVVVVGVTLAIAWRLPDGSPALRAAQEGSLGMRMGLRIARAATDGDGDGFSARFGGADCDDRRADVYPGAEDVPGNGVDENCEGGDAPAVAEDAGEAESKNGGEGTGDAVAPDPTKNRAAAQAASPGGAAGKFAGNILIITIDALRADRLGVAGYGRPAGKSLTPNLDALAKRGAYFRRAWSQAPNTPRSFPAILTSQYPSAVKWDNPTVNYPLVLPSNHTVFEDLRAAGLAPVGIFSHFYFTAERGISKSFKEWSNDGAGTIAESNKDSASPRIVPKVIARLKKAAAARERFVVWTHLFEPHSSYMPHKEFPSSGVGGVPGLMEKYDHEIAFVDSWVGKLVKALDDLGLADSTAVVVMADHGEAWGEHKVYFHGQDLFDEQLRIPLIIAVPGRAPVVSNEPVAAVDMAPTLADLVGAPKAKSFRGRSLLSVVDGGGPLPPRPIYGELMPATAWPHHAVMMVDGDHKVIHRVSDRRWELYDLAADPGEKRNIADDAAHKATFERLRAALLAFEERKR